jgi:type I restriction enzyme M protein
VPPIWIKPLIIRSFHSSGASLTTFCVTFFRHRKYPDVILPMYVLRRMDAVRADQEGRTRNKKMLDDARITEQRTALCEASGHAFYNTSIFTLRDLKSRGNRQQLLADFEV